MQEFATVGLHITNQARQMFVNIVDDVVVGLVSLFVDKGKPYNAATTAAAATTVVHADKVQDRAVSIVPGKWHLQIRRKVSVCPRRTRTTQHEQTPQVQDRIVSHISHVRLLPVWTTMPFRPRQHPEPHDEPGKTAAEQDQFHAIQPATAVALGEPTVVWKPGLVLVIDKRHATIKPKLVARLSNQRATYVTSQSPHVLQFTRATARSLRRQSLCCRPTANVRIQSIRSQVLNALPQNATTKSNVENILKLLCNNIISYPEEKAKKKQKRPTTIGLYRVKQQTNITY
jgi:hypothetical protein